MNLSNILNQKSVQSNIPPYFEYKESQCISYSYKSSVATKIFNYKRSLQQIDFQSLSQNPLPCSCSGSEFLYAPCGHIVTGDLNIVRNDKLRDLLRKGPKYREPVSFSWHQNFDIIMDACEAYAKRLAKKEDVELDTLSEWIKSIGNVLKRRIRRLKAILQVLIYKALYDKSYLGSKTTMTSGEWTCLISFATAPLTCSERGGSEKFKMKIYVSSGIRTHTPPVHDRKVAAP